MFFANVGVDRTKADFTLVALPKPWRSMPVMK